MENQNELNKFMSDYSLQQLEKLKHDDKITPISESVPKRDKIGRNDPCPCGSGKKYKKCWMTYGPALPEPLHETGQPVPIASTNRWISEMKVQLLIIILNV